MYISQNNISTVMSKSNESKIQKERLDREYPWVQLKGLDFQVSLSILVKILSYLIHNEPDPKIALKLTWPLRVGLYLNLMGRSSTKEHVTSGCRRNVSG